MTQSPRLDPAERAELVRLLPPPGDPALSSDRHLLLKDAFMQQITEPPAVRSRRRLVLFAAPVAAALVIGVIVGAAATNVRTTGETTTATRPLVAVATGDALGVKPLLERAAAAAGREPVAPVGKGEFVYVKSRVAWLHLPDEEVDRAVLDQVHDREVWLPASYGSEGLIRERGETFGLSGATPNSRYADLPTDPAALLQRVYVDTRGQDSGPDVAAFAFLGDVLRESLLPPQVTAALYRAAAQIPGVVLVADSVDAEGRHGVAVGRTDDRGERLEWIFDATTLEYLGERSYLVRDTDIGKAGMLTGTTAVLDRGVVHRKGELPR
jgi:hypothetical protein